MRFGAIKLRLRRITVGCFLSWEHSANEMDGAAGLVSLFPLHDTFRSTAALAIFEEQR